MKPSLPESASWAPQAGAAAGASERHTPSRFSSATDAGVRQAAGWAAAAGRARGIAGGGRSSSSATDRPAVSGLAAAATGWVVRRGGPLLGAGGWARQSGNRAPARRQARRQARTQGRRKRSAGDAGSYNCYIDGRRHWRCGRGKGARAPPRHAGCAASRGEQGSVGRVGEQWASGGDCRRRQAASSAAIRRRLGVSSSAGRAGGAGVPGLRGRHPVSALEPSQAVAEQAAGPVGDAGERGMAPLHGANWGSRAGAAATCAAAQRAAEGSACARHTCSPACYWPWPLIRSSAH